MKRDATEQEAEMALTRLRPMIDAAENSNQAGENAVVQLLHAYDSHSSLLLALDKVRILFDYLKRQIEIADTLDGVNFSHVLEIDPEIRALLAKAKGAS